jgi:hypothetical protein
MITQLNLTTWLQHSVTQGQTGTQENVLDRQLSCHGERELVKQTF